MACDYCASDPHSTLCPMTAIEANPARKQAFDLGVPVATSDWIDAWGRANTTQTPWTWRARLAEWLYPPAFTGFGGPERESLIESFSLHHNHVARVTKLEAVHG